MHDLHKNNLDFILDKLQNKPIMVAKFRQVLEFQDKYLTEVGFEFPVIETTVNVDAVVEEWKKSNPKKAKEIEYKWRNSLVGDSSTIDGVGGECNTPCPVGHFVKFIDRCDFIDKENIIKWSHDNYDIIKKLEEKYCTDNNSCVTKSKEEAMLRCYGTKLPLKVLENAYLDSLSLADSTEQ